MFTTFLAILFTIHGLVHIIGARNKAATKEHYLNKTLPLLWLLASLLLFFTAYFVITGKIWWSFGLGSILLSQLLIFSDWHKAKWGTIVNLLILLFCFFAYTTWRFDESVERDISKLTSYATKKDDTIRQADIEHLPHPVRTWLLHSNVVGMPKPAIVYLKERGFMRTDINGKWMPVTAEQYFTIQPPGFVWYADVKMLPFISLKGRDKFSGDGSNMLIKILGLITVANASGYKTDQGTMLRYMGEIIWFPAAAVNPYIRWTEINDTTAQATMTYRSLTATGVFTFSKEGKFLSFSAQRYLGGGAGSKLEQWYIPATAWRNIRGHNIPVKGNAIWKLNGGDFNYFKWEITDIQYK